MKDYRKMDPKFYSIIIIIIKSTYIEYEFIEKVRTPLIIFILLSKKQILRIFIFKK